MLSLIWEMIAVAIILCIARLSQYISAVAQTHLTQTYEIIFCIEKLYVDCLVRRNLFSGSALFM